MNGNIFVDAEDFDNFTVIETIQSDEGSNLIANLSLNIQIFDDDVVEANQYFLVYLMIHDAVNSSIINIERSVARCSIIDNDG